MKPLSLEHYDVLLFDLDDTLFGHSEAYEEGVYDTLQHFPELKELDPIIFYKTFLKHNHLLWSKFSSKELNFHEFSLKRLDNTLKEFNISVEEEVSDAIVKVFQCSYLNRIHPNKELNDFLLKVSWSVGVGIVTNGTAYNAYEKVHRLELSTIFPESSIIISEKVGFSKPDTEIFQHTLNAFESSPGRTLFIGDNYYTDIVGAKSLGLDTLWINKFGYECPQERPDFTLKCLLEMKELILKV
ncbi:HAD family hydrolase [Rossellomorea sp. NRS-1567]|uniref:HAD family hydrolase n=1 Tax=Rossellomorea sp. NRS-1567 TaxID=3233901 RepID=UPI003D2DB3A5